MVVIERCSVWLIGPVLLGLLGVDIAVITLIASGTSNDVSAIPIVLAVTSLVGAFVLAPLRFEISRSTVRLSALYVVSVRIQRDDITSVETTEASPLRHGGIGVRGTNGGLAFIARQGPAVAVRTNSGKRYMFTTSRAQEVVAELSR